jgi:stage IV sporulation protein FB
VVIGNLPPTPADLNFSLFGIPVRVHPLFWLAAVLLGGLDLPPKYLLVWVAVVFVSILIHEMGHALVIRQFGMWPRILLYTFGGLAIYDPVRRDPRRQMLISLAGPAAGFLLAGAIVLLSKANGHPVEFQIGPPFGLEIIPARFENPLVTMSVYFLLQVNIWWGLMNLLPVYPLDGGQFLYALLEWLRTPDAMVKSLWVSIVTAGAVAIYAATRVHDLYLTVLFAYLAFSNFQTLQSFTGRGGGYGRW